MKTVLVWREGQEKCLGVPGMSRKVYWRSGNVKKSVKAWREWLEKCLGLAGMARKVVWKSGSDTTSKHWQGQVKCFGIVGMKIGPPSAAIKSKQRLPPPVTFPMMMFT